METVRRLFLEAQAVGSTPHLAWLVGRLYELLAANPGFAADAITEFINSDEALPSFVQDVLPWLVVVAHPVTLGARMWILESGLTSASPEIRLGAIVGINVVGSKLAVPALQRALSRETMPRLRRALEGVLKRLAPADEEGEDEYACAGVHIPSTRHRELFRETVELRTSELPRWRPSYHPGSLYSDPEDE